MERDGFDSDRVNLGVLKLGRGQAPQMLNEGETSSHLVRFRERLGRFSGGRYEAWEIDRLSPTLEEGTLTGMDSEV